LRWLRELRALFFLGQADAPIRVFVNFSVLLHFSGELHQGAAPRVSQAERRRDFAQILRPAGLREVREDFGFGDRFAGLGLAWHGNGIVCALPAKREG
jgi:hypothetical protein